MKDAWEPLGIVALALVARLEKRPSPEARPVMGGRSVFTAEKEKPPGSWLAAKQAANSANPPEAMTKKAVDPADEGHAALLGGYRSGRN